MRDPYGIGSVMMDAALAACVFLAWGWIAVGSVAMAYTLTWHF